MGEPPYELEADPAADIDTYESDVRGFLSGGMPAAVLKAKRVPRGIYEQRQDGTYMVRVRVTAGVLRCEQVQMLSELSREFGDGVLHITTRQDVQFHDISIQHTPEIMRRLLRVGLTTKGGGGNTVRTITTCPYAGICPNECFDPSGFAHAVTDYLIRLVGSYNLPRKYKIAFSGCRADCGLAKISDLGFIADIHNGKPGFRVFAGGGMGAHSRIGSLLWEWIPAEDVIRVSEAIRRLFDKHGDRKNRQRARLRFVFDRIGDDEFRRLLGDEMVRVIETGVPPCDPQADLTANPPNRQPESPVLEEMDGIRCLPQKQEGWVSVPLHPRLGLIPAEDFASLGRLAERFSAEGGLWTTRSQQLQIRFVPKPDLHILAAELRKLTTDFVNSNSAAKCFTTCAGAATCRLGLCFSRNAALACEEQLRDSGLTGVLDGFAVYVNGCPNACGHQPIAPIGLSGAAHRVDGHLVPAYRVTMGGRCDADGARLGSAVGQVPAKALPGFIREVAADYINHRMQGETFTKYFERTDQGHFTNMLSRYTPVPEFEDRPEFFQDFGSDEYFSLAGRGAGE